MKQLIFFATVIFCIYATMDIAAHQNKQDDKLANTVLATVGNEKITYQMLENAFQKNMNRKGVKLTNVPKDSVIDFLNLYINYRLKVYDALGRGFASDQSVVDDIEQNRRILAESFFYEKKITEPYLEKWLKMREVEYQVAVIITAYGFDNDTTKAYDNINKALSELKIGTPFEKVAEMYSDDPETAKQGGLVVNYITAGRVNRELENTIYTLGKGEYTQDYIKTRFGYFLIKVIDKQPRNYLAMRTIILENSGNIDKDVFKSAADSLVNIMRQGKADFSAMARKHSADVKTAANGGFIGDFYTRSTGVGNTGETFVPAIENAVYSMKGGDISEPIEVINNLHIFKLDSVFPMNNYVEKEDLRALYRRLYFNEDKKDYIKSLAVELGFKIDDKVFAELYSKLDTTKTTLDTAWTNDISNNLNKKNLYKLNNENTSVEDFVGQLKTRSDFRGHPLSHEGIVKAIEKIIEPKVFDLATDNLEKDYPEFRTLVNEFRDGILLFKVEALEVWDKMKFDSVLARKFYDTTAMDLTRPEMFDLGEIFLLTDSTANNLYQRITSNDISFENAAGEFTQRAGMRAKNGHLGIFSVERHKLAQWAKDHNMKQGEILPPFEYDKGYVILRLNKFEPARRKTFEESIPDIAPKVQDMIQKRLTEKWLDDIRKKYPVKIDNKTINSVMK